MNKLLSAANKEVLFMGNEAIARGALEAGVNVAAAYPGTPSSEVIENLASVARQRNLYVEWSANEKVAVEVAAAASFAGLRSMCVMKQNGVNVASDFLLHLTASGTRGGIVLVSCEDPGALSSVNEGESRYFARMLEMPLLEPADFQEAKDLTKWAFELSEKVHNIVMLRSVTRMSHASGNVICGKMPTKIPRARFVYDGPLTDPLKGPVISTPVGVKHKLQQEKLKKPESFLKKSFQQIYRTTKTADSDHYQQRLFPLQQGSSEHVESAKTCGHTETQLHLAAAGKTAEKYLRLASKIMVVEEVLPFMEENIKVLAASYPREIGAKTFHGKIDGTFLRGRAQSRYGGAGAGQNHES